MEHVQEKGGVQDLALKKHGPRQKLWVQEKEERLYVAERKRVMSTPNYFPTHT